MKTRQEIASLIDHSVLTPFVTLTEVHEELWKCQKYKVGHICLYPTHVNMLRSFWSSCTQRIAVVGFPSGMATVDAKIHEIVHTPDATEFDVVVDGSLLRSRKHEWFRDELARIVGAARGRPVKAIIEVGRLDRAERIKGYELARDAGVAFVKTSTGFGPRVTMSHDVELAVATLQGSSVRVKAAGGIRAPYDVQTMLDAGCSRIGTSHTFSILDAWPEK